jgi:hypothetical protein
MALPIGCTPTLKGKEATEFVKKIRREETDMKPLVPTPKLRSVRKKILSDAKTRKKQF